MRTPRRRVWSIFLVLATLLATSCTDDNSNPLPPPGVAGLPTFSTKDTLVFGVGQAQSLDPALAPDAESLRVARQVLETLVQIQPGTARVMPGLAESFTADPTGTVWTFLLKRGVKFHDGTDFDAAAVCANFDRWYHFTGLLQNADVSAYWQLVFGGFAQNRSSRLPASLFKSCTATDANTAVLTLTKASSRFPAALAVPAFAISSPAALQKYQADNFKGGTGYPAYAEHPVGTGPYRLVSWDRKARRITMEAFEGYHGTKAKIKNLVFQAIEANQRKQALLDGSVQGYDLVNPADMKELGEKGYKLLPRPPYNVLYLGINQAGNPALAKPEVRQAIAYAVNRQRIVDEVFPPGAKVALNFQPDSAAGFNPDVNDYKANPQQAKVLLERAGYPNGLTLRLHYPTNIYRDYLPDPKKIVELITEDLKAVGITVQPTALPWNPAYLNTVTKGSAHDLHLFGWEGDIGDAYTFLGSLFDKRSAEFGFTDADLFGALKEADGASWLRRPDLYRALNASLMQKLPAVPLVHGPTTLVTVQDLVGIVPSPLTDEHYAEALFL
ncbi:ABC transporter substrate-binding protein [Catellatospora tritici]|uniref:ABC transporter substrate-binding protein n=1 Tax=Catellatospora tritici TaxID=2851566 RepID=UPI001C2D821B|nr:ABC transporter substrate-binding protein [Catellatospora tritici]MBV1853382.1 ABC transporter substrate-binding protein [Catellatospora tritici]